jgi:hypothetical protein
MHIQPPQAAQRFAARSALDTLTPGKLLPRCIAVWILRFSKQLAVALCQTLFASAITTA